MVNEYDKRQLEIMLVKIRSFRKNALGLLNLINDLSSLLDVLECVADSWKEECKSWVWDLEEVYAVALDRKQALNTDDLQGVEDALNQIELLVKNKLSESREGLSEN